MKNMCLLLMAGCFCLYAETQEQISKQFNLQPGGQLIVDVDFGSIDVSPAKGSEASVEVVRKVSRGGKEAEETFLKNRPVVIEQDGNTLRIRSRATTRERGSWWRGSQRTEAKYTIRVPARFQIDVKTSGGSIAVARLEGETKVKTSGGSLNLANIRGNVEGSTSGGSIRVKDCDGPVAVRTSGGSIDIENAANKVDATTSGGSVSATFKGPIREEVNLTTSGGGVTLRVPEKSAFNLDASTGGGSVSSELPVALEGKPKRTQLKGPVNGGGKPVLLRTSGGSVRVKAL